MKLNVGSTDRMIRIVAGLVMLSGFFWFPEGARWASVIGLVPLLTGVVRFCPAYALIGVNTCSTDARG